MSDYNAVAPPSTVENNVDQISAYADALQRARQIAAKINPSAKPNTNGTPTTGQKRPLEDAAAMEYHDGSAPKKVAALNDPFGAQLAAIQRGAAPNAVLTEEYKVPDKMVGLIIGRGGEQITRLQADTGCKVQMAADSGGLPDRSCSLSGTRQSIEKAKEMIQSIIKRGAPMAPSGGMMEPSMGGSHYVEVSVPAGKVGLVIGTGGKTIKELQDRAGVKMVMIQDDKIMTGMDKPLRISGEPQKCEYAKQLIMDLITEKELEGQGRPGFRNHYNNEYGGSSQNRNEIPVPKPAVGVVIGKSGVMIQKIQNDTGAKVQFQQGKDDGPGDKLCLITGSPDQVHHASNIIHDLINSVMSQGGGGGGNMRGGPGRGGGGGGPGRDGGFGGDRRSGFGSNQESTTYTVPANKCGIVIGKGGETIRLINQQSGAHVELDRNNQQSQFEKSFVIKGSPDQIQKAQELIAEKIGGPPGGGMGNSTQYPMSSQQDPSQGQAFAAAAAQGWGNAYQQWNQPAAAAQADPASANAAAAQPATTAGGQPDYSQAWVEYYRSVGMFREAEMVEQQARANQAAVAGQPQAQQPVAMAQPTQPTQYPAGSGPAVGGQGQPGQATQQFAAQYTQYAAQPQQPQQFSGQQPGGAAAAAQYGYNYPGYNGQQQ